VTPEHFSVDTGSATLACLSFGSGQPVLCAHGFPDCAWSFRHQVAPLVERGYRVVAPWMRGYAPSSLARDGRYDVAALANDLCALAEHLGGRVRLVGHDWGAIAAYAACARSPELFSQLCTIAVPHLRVAGPRWIRPSQLRKSWYMGFFQLRFLAERKVSADHFAFIDRLWRDWSPGYQATREELDEVKSAIAPPDHLRAVLGYYRALFSAPTRRHGGRLLRAKTRVPAIYVHGLDDGCAGVELCDGVEAAYEVGVKVHRLPGGHFVHLESPSEFNRVLIDFFSDDRRKSGTAEGSVPGT
jgi:pimeloyl-ACP methyl ester carboxylesterase